MDAYNAYYNTNDISGIAQNHGNQNNNGDRLTNNPAKSN